MQINPSCEIRAFVASFGTDGFAQQFEALFSIPDDVLQDSLGNTLSPSQIDNIRQKIPSPVMKSINQCRVHLEAPA
ncbi:spherulin-1A [Penicillium desertorum]|uniref:Spherulin-1A n=1 Tax=Penicillium desertorum TaxID=1303715 RepID=A0A9W9WI05_9EURO|nr:spherulin-1A [Penicillium desertorum]